MMQNLKTNYLVEAIGGITGNLEVQKRVVLEKDTVPAIDKAALTFNTKKQNRLSVLVLRALVFLRSLAGKTHTP